MKRRDQTYNMRASLFRFKFFTRTAFLFKNNLRLFSFQMYLLSPRSFDLTACSLSLDDVVFYLENCEVKLVREYLGQNASFEAVLSYAPYLYFARLFDKAEQD